MGVKFITAVLAWRPHKNPGLKNENIDWIWKFDSVSLLNKNSPDQQYDQYAPMCGNMIATRALRFEHDYTSSPGELDFWTY